VSDTELGAGGLARIGFVESASALPLFTRLPSSLQAVLPRHLSTAAEPDLALRALSKLLQAADAAGLGDAIADRFGSDEAFAGRLIRLLGASVALGDFVATHPAAYDLVAGDSAGLELWAASVRAALVDSMDGHADDVLGGGSTPLDALRLTYRGAVAHLAARDLAGEIAYDEVASTLSDLAVAVLEAGVSIARKTVGDRADSTELAVVALGKCGGHELNYVSDVDVVFVAEPSGDVPTRVATAIATHVMRTASAHTSTGTIWAVDAGLRPEGRNGQLVRTVDSYLHYYRRWAKTWEFQAMLKARPAAGDLPLATRLVELLSPMIWQAADRPGFVDDAQAMRRRVIDHLGEDPRREIKLGPGGLRDVEFAVQLLQLVHGRTDETLRSPTTLVALTALVDGGYVGREDGAALAEAYRFLRALEHRLQLHRLTRTHTLPTDPMALRRIGRSMGFFDDPERELARAWNDTAVTVRRLHEKLFYRPVLAAVARIPGEESRLTPEAAQQRLTALGYGDPEAAVRHIRVLTDGVSRRSAIQRQLLPALLSWFADSPNPDAGLLSFRRLSDSLGSTPWYLRLLRDEGVAAQRMATVLATSRYASGMFERAPEAVQVLGERDLLAVDLAGVRDQMHAAAARQASASDAVAAIRSIRRRYLLAVAVADLTGDAPLDRVCAGLTTIADATLGAAAEVAGRAVDERRGEPALGEFAVVAMGRLGGREVGYGSDADVVFVSRPEREAALERTSEWSVAVASELRRLLGAPASDPPVQVDADLRPEGRNGPLVRTIDSYAAYYARWSMAWEAQALLRARPIEPSGALGADFTAMIDPLRYPHGGIGPQDVREIRRIKARVDTERLPRGADRTTHTKLGRGGLADVEWTVQLLQMQHAHAVPELRTTQTLPALRSAAAAGLIAERDAVALTEAWTLAMRTRNAIMLVRGRPSDTLPTDARELAAVAQLLGVEGAAPFVEHYRRVTRHAHTVVDRVFYAG